MVNLVCVDECAASSLNEKLVQALTERDALKAKVHELYTEVERLSRELARG